MNRLANAVRARIACGMASGAGTLGFGFSTSPQSEAKPASARPIVICGPSGVGKGTLIAKLMKDYPSAVGFSVSHTTRQPRPGEVDGEHYHFTTKVRIGLSRNGIGCLDIVSIGMVCTVGVRTY
jgi:hypothetical protein